jgi:hypothetical protein
MCLIREQAIEECFQCFGEKASGECLMFRIFAQLFGDKDAS